MTPQEAKKFLDEQKAQGHSDEEILAVLYSMFIDDSINIDQLEALVGAMGYRLTEEFKNMSPEDQKTKGWGEEEAEEDKPAEGAEAPKEEDKTEPAQEAPAKEEEKTEPAQEAPKNDDNEEEEAKKLFGLNK